MVVTSHTFIQDLPSSCSCPIILALAQHAHAFPEGQPTSIQSPRAWSMSGSTATFTCWRPAIDVTIELHVPRHVTPPCQGGGWARAHLLDLWQLGRQELPRYEEGPSQGYKGADAYQAHFYSLTHPCLRLLHLREDLQAQRQATVRPLSFLGLWPASPAGYQYLRVIRHRTWLSQWTFLRGSTREESH